MEISLNGPAGPDPYLEELDSDFTHNSVGTLRRPAFSEFGCGTPHCQLWLPLSRRVTQHRSWFRLGDVTGPQIEVAYQPKPTPGATGKGVTDSVGIGQEHHAHPFDVRGAKTLSRSR